MAKPKTVAKPKTLAGNKPLAGNPAFVQLGELGRAHGLKGEIRLKSFTAEPDAIAAYAPLLTEAGQSVVITDLRPAAGGQPDMFVARLDGVDSRDKAEALNRTGLYLERARLPEPKEEDEFLHADLIGLKAVDPAGAALGTVAAISNYGGGDILELEPGGLMVPFTTAFVPEIDVKNGRIIIDYAESDDGDDA